MNTHEKEPELGEGVTSAEFWVYDGKLGRRWNVDPVVKQWEASYMTFGNNPILLLDINGDDWGVKTQGEGKDAKSTLTSDAGDDINTFREWYKNSGLKLTTDQYSKLELDLAAALAKAGNVTTQIEIEANATLQNGGIKKTLFQQAPISYDLSDNILSIRIHAALENRDGLGGGMDGHFGLEFQGNVYHYFWDTDADNNGTQDVFFDHFQKNPFATAPGMAYVDPASDFANVGGHGYHRGRNYNKNPGSTGRGQDFFTTINLTFEQYKALTSSLASYSSSQNNTATNYGFFGKQYIFGGKPQLRCMSWVFTQTSSAGVNFGISHFKWIKTVTPKTLLKNIEKYGYKFTEIKEGSTYTPLWR